MISGSKMKQKTMDIRTGFTMIVERKDGYCFSLEFSMEEWNKS